MFFTCQSLFPEAAAGTATEPCHSLLGALKPPHAAPARVPIKKDGVHWRKRRRPVKRLCIASRTLIFICNQIATQRFGSTNDLAKSMKCGDSVIMFQA